MRVAYLISLDLVTLLKFSTSNTYFDFAGIMPPASCRRHHAAGMLASTRPGVQQNLCYVGWTTGVRGIAYASRTVGCSVETFSAGIGTFNFTGGPLLGGLGDGGGT